MNKLTKEEVEKIINFYKDLRTKFPDFIYGALMVDYWEEVSQKGRSKLLD